MEFRVSVLFFKKIKGHCILKESGKASWNILNEQRKIFSLTFLSTIKIQCNIFIYAHIKYQSKIATSVTLSWGSLSFTSRVWRHVDCESRNMRCDSLTRCCTCNMTWRDIDVRPHAARIEILTCQSVSEWSHRLRHETSRQVIYQK